MTYVRIGHFKSKSDSAAELCRIYEQEAIPEIRASEGNVSAALLRQHQEADAFLAITLWRTRASAEAYDASGAAARVVGKVRHLFDGPPTLTTYDAFGV
ncbi:MAG: antibiotic biosynthesis monooxygenase [Aestuariivirga sp.]